MTTPRKATKDGDSPAAPKWKVREHMMIPLIGGS